MIQLANLVLSIFLALAVAWLLYDRLKSRERVEEREREDLVDRPELDGYHHRVVQLYQTHRDWSRGKFEEFEHHLDALRKNRPVLESEAPSPTTTERVAGEVLEKPPEKTLPAPESLTQPIPLASEAEDRNAPEKPFETATDTESFSTAESRVLEAWTRGASVDEIARDLRMGRQEVQLLIQVSRGRPVSRVEG